MHKASGGIGVTIKKSTWQEELLKFQKTIRGIKIFKELALLHEYKSGFDQVFLTHVDSYIKEIEEYQVSYFYFLFKVMQ